MSVLNITLVIPLDRQIIFVEIVLISKGKMWPETGKMEVVVANSNTFYMSALTVCRSHL
jgi:hypothetical protein